MSPEVVPRLNGSVYVGRRRHFVTVWTFHRTDASHTDPTVEGVLMALRQCAVHYQFAIHAYCFMPDHVPLFLEGLSDSSDLRRFIRDWKQRTTYEYRNTTGGDLWQRGHVDHVLRPDEDADVVMRYVLGAPVRAGLVPPSGEYRYVGSDTGATDGVLLPAAGATAREPAQGPPPGGCLRKSADGPAWRL
jgi:REP element-mobilizing transposase RayT